MAQYSESAVTAARDLRVIFSRLRRRLTEVSGGDGLTPSQTAVLIRLWKDGPASTSQLAGAERVRPQSMAATVAALDNHGLICRTPDPEDGRRTELSLTAEGRRRAESDRQIRDEWLTQQLQNLFTDKERRVIVDALTLLGRLTD